MIEIRKAELTEPVVERLIRLSELWMEEGCSFGMVKNTREDIKEPVFAAFDGVEIVGYAFGHFYTPDKMTSCIEIGSRCFSVDELYVLPEYRSQGVGRRLFRALEAEARQNAAYLTLSTSTKDYKEVLKFYIEDNEMFFHDAFLIKAFPGESE